MYSYKTACHLCLWCNVIVCIVIKAALVIKRMIVTHCQKSYATALVEYIVKRLIFGDVVFFHSYSEGGITELVCLALSCRSEKVRCVFVHKYAYGHIRVFCLLACDFFPDISFPFAICGIVRIKGSRAWRGCVLRRYPCQGSA